MEKIMDFLNNIYSYEYFGFYLILSIIVLIILFLVILFYGKKDKKNREIEATKKLQQINAETFKEDSIEEKVEVNNISLENNLEDTIVVSNIEEVPTLNNVETNDEIPEPVLPVIEEVVEEKTEEQETTIPEPEFPIIEEQNIQHVEDDVPVVEETFEPILDRIEEKPLVFDNTNIFTKDFVEQVQEAPALKEEFPKFDEIELPAYNSEENVKEKEEEKTTPSYINGPQIFSSVYVPEKKEEVELPKEEISVEKALEDLDLELPTLKKVEAPVVEEKKEEIEKPILTDYNLDELSGETYTINK